MNSIGPRRLAEWARVLCVALLSMSPCAAAEGSGRAEVIRSETERIRARVESLGGWDTWNTSLTAWRRAIAELPVAGNARGGVEQTLFHGGTTGFLQRAAGPIEGDGAAPSWCASAVTAARELSAVLAARGIDLIVAPVPCKLSIYPERSGTTPPSEVGVQYLWLMSELLANDVEVIDLYTPFVENRFDGNELLYYRTDHHWNGRGIALAASVIAKRLSRYPAIAEATAATARYACKGVNAKQWRGELAQGADVKEYPPEDIERFQVTTSSGALYDEGTAGPILVVGDSFAQYARFKGTATDIGANLTYQLNCPVQTLVNYGIVAHQLPRLIWRQPPEFLDNRIVVVWIMMDIAFQEKL